MAPCILVFSPVFPPQVFAICDTSCLSPSTPPPQMGSCTYSWLRLLQLCKCKTPAWATPPDTHYQVHTRGSLSSCAIAPSCHDACHQPGLQHRGTGESAAMGDRSIARAPQLHADRIMLCLLSLASTITSHYLVASPSSRAPACRPPNPPQCTSQGRVCNHQRAHGWPGPLQLPGSL